MEGDEAPGEAVTVLEQKKQNKGESKGRLFPPPLPPNTPSLLLIDLRVPKCPNGGTQPTVSRYSFTASTAVLRQRDYSG